MQDRENATREIRRRNGTIPTPEQPPEEQPLQKQRAQKQRAQKQTAQKQPAQKQPAQPDRIGDDRIGDDPTPAEPTRGGTAQAEPNGGLPRRERGDSLGAGETFTDLPTGWDALIKGPYANNERVLDRIIVILRSL
jgi:hypothetical protein